MVAKIAILRILKAGVLPTEGQKHITCGSLTVLGNNYLCHTMKVTSVLILINVIVLWTVYKDDHISILLDGSRLTQIRQLRTLAVESLTTLHTTVQLT